MEKDKEIIAVKNDDYDMNDYSLHLSEIRYVFTFLNIAEDFTYYRTIYRIKANGLVRIREEKIENGMNSHKKTTLKILSREQYRVDPKLVKEFADELMEVVRTADKSPMYIDDCSGSVEIVYTNTSLRIRADRGLSNSATSINEVVGYFLHRILKNKNN